jgi:hypothetical protein
MRELVKTILERGVANVEFTVPIRPLRTCMIIAYTTSNDEPEPVRCRIIEDRYKVDENYKIELIPHDYPAHPKKSFYVSDFESLMRGDSDSYKMHIAEMV